MSTMYNGELLDLLEDRGYPVDYLYARLRGRRSRLITDWKAFVYEASPLEVLSGGASRGGVRDRTTEGIWVNLLREYRWVCRQMNSRLREIFGPYFLYAELRTLFIGLRHIKESRTEETADLLSESLLSGKIKAMLTTSKKLEVAATALERAFLTLSTSFSGIDGSLEKEGLRGFEQDLTNRYLVHIMNRGLHPLVRMFFSRIIDARNILALYKALRMSVRAKPLFLAGGAITSERFRDILKSDDLFAVKSLVRDRTGIRIDSPDITKVESALYRGLAKYLRKEGRDPLNVGLLLDYLWRCSLEAMNLSILVHTREIDRESVIAELVY